MSQAVTNQRQSMCTHYLQRSILSFSEAIQRFQRLDPGSPEHLQLQSILVKRIGITEVTLPTSSYKIYPFPSEDQLIGGFGSSEHVAIGRKVRLEGLREAEPLLVIGMNSVGFHHIVALAGDVYGVAGRPISWLGGDSGEKTARFQEAFNTLAQSDPVQLQKILIEIDQECLDVETSGLPHHCYSNQMMVRLQALIKIKSDIQDLLEDNSDHFSINAKDAYQIGHTLAIEEARNAGKRGDLEGLKMAYALDAFACHFLTDLFASGHVRNQRGELETFLISTLGFESWAKKLAGILTAAQHEKDGHEGLNVCNGRGEYWRAYGDGQFFLPKNEENRRKVIEATQRSVDEVYAAYQSPHVVNPSLIHEYFPHATEFNPPPLYKIEGGVLLLYKDGDWKQVHNQLDYWNKGLSQALPHLPQSYVDGFINALPDTFLTRFNLPSFNLSPILKQGVMPQIERLTGVIWLTLGIASARQLRKQDAQLNQKIDEIADTLQATYKETSIILEKLEECLQNTVHLRWAHTFQELKEAIGVVKNKSYEYHHFTLNDDQKRQARNDLWQAQIQMGRLLKEGVTADGILLLPSYALMLKATSQRETSEMEIDEMKAMVTSWFKQLIDYQSHAFSLYGLLYLEQDPSDAKLFLRSQVLDFQQAVEQQIEANREWIDVGLLNQNPSYITLQIEKLKFKRLWALQN